MVEIRADTRDDAAGSTCARRARPAAARWPRLTAFMPAPPSDDRFFAIDHEIGKAVLQPCSTAWPGRDDARFRERVSSACETSSLSTRPVVAPRRLLCPLVGPDVDRCPGLERRTGRAGLRRHGARFERDDAPAG